MRNINPGRHLLVLAALVLVVVILSAACGAEKPTPTATPRVAPTATAVPTATPTQVSTVATPTPTQAPRATATATATSTPAAAKPVVLKMGSYFWSKNDPTEDHYAVFLHGAAFDRLVRVTDDGVIVPQLATKWEMLDPKTWRFTLRKDLRFHDGTPVTPADMKFTIERSLAGHGPVDNVRSVQEVVVVDDATLDLKLNAPDVFIPAKMRLLFIVPKAYIEKNGWDQWPIKPMGSGPWKWTEWVPWERTKTERAGGEHPFRKVQLDRIEMYYIPDNATAISALRTGAVDYSYANLEPDHAQELEKRGFGVLATQTAQILMMLSPKEACEAKYPTCDKRVRQAINLAIDRESLAKNLWRGYAKPASQPGIPGHSGYDDTIPVRYDPKEAERLLDAAGFPKGPDGIRFQIDYWNWQAGLGHFQALAITDMLGQVGIKANYSLVEIGAYLDMFFRRDGRKWKPLSQIWLPDALGDNTNQFFPLCGDAPSKCPYQYGNPDYLALRSQLLAEPDAGKRTEITKKIMRILVDDPYAVYTVVAPTFHVYAKNWTGIDTQGGGYPHLDAVRPVTK